MPIEALCLALGCTGSLGSMHTNASIAKDISRHVSNQHASSNTIPATASLSVLTALQQLFDLRMQRFTVVNRCAGLEPGTNSLHHASLRTRNCLKISFTSMTHQSRDLAGQSLASGVGPQQWNSMASDGINIMNLQILMQTMIKKYQKIIKHPVVNCGAIVTDPMPLRPRMLLSCLHPLIHEQLKPWSRSGRLAMNLQGNVGLTAHSYNLRSEVRKLLHQWTNSNEPWSRTTGCSFVALAVDGTATSTAKICY